MLQLSCIVYIVLESVKSCVAILRNMRNMRNMQLCRTLSTSRLKGLALQKFSLQPHISDATCTGTPYRAVLL